MPFLLFLPLPLAAIAAIAAIAIAAPLVLLPVVTFPILRLPSPVASTGITPVVLPFTLIPGFAALPLVVGASSAEPVPRHGCLQARLWLWLS